MSRFARNALLYLAMLALLVAFAWLLGYGTPGGNGG